VGERAIGDAPISTRILLRGYSENAVVLGDPLLTTDRWWEVEETDRAAYAQAAR
jgi:hypothetical protein